MTFPLLWKFTNLLILKFPLNKIFCQYLTAKCALAGCHVADGPHGLDFRTYESFIAGGEHGPVFIPGNAEESEVIEEIVSGNMPLNGPPLPDAEIQLFRDWINQQEAQEVVVQHDHDDGMDDHDNDDMDEHDGMDEDHDNDDDDMDDDDDDHDENEHKDDGHDD